MWCYIIAQGYTCLTNVSELDKLCHVYSQMRPWSPTSLSLKYCEPFAGYP
ncbi:hypothetical protein COCNU_scaffold022098G000010 [Cocos nucifera]|nr:hypothetical protein [Cocos nucifera]